MLGPRGASLKVLVAAAVLSLGCAADAAEGDVSTYRCRTVPGSHHAFATTDCPVPVRSDAEVSCGTLQLAEDPGAKQSCLVELAWVQYTPQQIADDVPVFVLGGGPGQAIVERSADVLELARRVAPQRRWIVHDPRGVGASTPRLDCSQSVPADGDFQTALAGCARMYLDGGHDAARYRTEVLADDVDALAEAFGAGQIDLFGASYGSRLAYTYAALYPGRTRALVLDAAVPIDAPLLEHPVSSYLQAMSRIAADCGASESCARWHGDVATLHESNIERLQAEAPIIEFDGGGIPLSAELYVSLTAVLASGSGTAAVPAFVRAVASSDYTPVEATLAETMTGSSLATFVHYAIQCSEELPQNDRARAQLDLAGLPAYSALLPYDALSTQCAALGLSPEDDEPLWHERLDPIASTTPVLALTGRYDPLAVATNWSGVRLGLPPGTLFELPDASHRARNSRCGTELITRFLGQPTTDLAAPADCTTSLDFFVERFAL